MGVGGGSKGLGGIFSSPEDLPDPGIQFASPALVDGFFTTEPPGKPLPMSIE